MLILLDCAALGRNIAFLCYKYSIQFSHNLSSIVSLIYDVNDLDLCRDGFGSCTSDALELDTIQKSAFIVNFSCYEIEEYVIIDI